MKKIIQFIFEFSGFGPVWLPYNFIPIWTSSSNSSLQTCAHLANGKCKNKHHKLSDRMRMILYRFCFQIFLLLFIFSILNILLRTHNFSFCWKLHWFFKCIEALWLQLVFSILCRNLFQILRHTLPHNLKALFGIIVPPFQALLLLSYLSRNYFRNCRDIQFYYSLTSVHFDLIVNKWFQWNANSYKQTQTKRTVALREKNTTEWLCKFFEIGKQKKILRNNRWLQPHAALSTILTHLTK